MVVVSAEDCKEFFSHILESNAKNIGDYGAEEREITWHGNFVGAFYRENWVEMAYAHLSRYNGFRYGSKEMGGNMYRVVGG